MNAKTEKPIPLSEVKSSNVAAVGYDASSQRFAVQFKGGAVYHYEAVDADTAEGIRTADSIGSAVNSRLVRGGYKFKKLGSDD